jgi:hypothetical protein
VRQHAELPEEIVRWGSEAYYHAARTGGKIGRRPSPLEASVVRDSLAMLAQSGVRSFLSRLNSRTRYRFTGVYRIEGEQLRNIALFDRENPWLRSGGDIKLLTETCCAMIEQTGRPFATADVPADDRLDALPARHASVKSYQGAPIFTSGGRLWGTLCHFDLRPRLLPEGEGDVLAWVASALPVGLLYLDEADDLPRSDESGSESGR